MSNKTHLRIVDHRPRPVYISELDYKNSALCGFVGVTTSVTQSDVTCSHCKNKIKKGDINE